MLSGACPCLVPVGKNTFTPLQDCDFRSAKAGSNGVSCSRPIGSPLLPRLPTQEHWRVAGTFDASLSSRLHTGSYGYGQGTSSWHAKNRRAVCVSLLAGALRSPALGQTLRHTCPCTPRLGNSFWPHHFTDEPGVANIIQGWVRRAVCLLHTWVVTGKTWQPMKSMWDTVGKLWDPCRLLTKLGHQSVRLGQCGHPTMSPHQHAVVDVSSYQWSTGVHLPDKPVQIPPLQVGQDCAEPSEQGHPRASGGRTGAGSQLELHAVHVLCLFKQCTSASLSIVHDFVTYRPCQAERCGAVCSKCKCDSWRVVPLVPVTSSRARIPATSQVSQGCGSTATGLVFWATWMRPAASQPTSLWRSAPRSTRSRVPRTNSSSLGLQPARPEPVEATGTLLAMASRLAWWRICLLPLMCPWNSLKRAATMQPGLNGVSFAAAAKATHHVRAAAMVIGLKKGDAGTHEHVFVTSPITGQQKKKRRGMSKAICKKMWDYGAACAQAWFYAMWTDGV